MSSARTVTPCASAMAAKAFAIGAGGREGGQEIDAGVAAHGLGDGQGARARRAGSRCGRETRRSGCRRSRPRACRIAAASAITSVIVGAGAIPLEHRELGVVERAALAIAEHRREREDPLLARSEQLLHGELGRGVEIERTVCRARARSARSRRPADGSRCRARPDEAGRVDLDEALAPRTRRGSAVLIARAPEETGRRSAWRSGLHQGEGIRAC